MFENSVGLNAGAGLLVRPDQHILAHLAKDISVEKMHTILQKELGL